MKLSYFNWIAEVCRLMNQPKEYGANLVEDPSWFGCWDDGMTPEEALAEYKEYNENIVD